MNLKTCLWPLALLASLTACTHQPETEPVLVRPVYADALTVCEATPPNPCPALPPPEPEPEEPPQTLLARLPFFNKVEEIPALGPPAPVYVCTEKDRLRWEARLKHAHADCKSKLNALGKLLKKQATGPPE